MIQTVISTEILKKYPNIQIGSIQATLIVSDKTERLWSEINDQIRYLSENFKVEDIAKQNIIKNSRKAYKACGKDPARYRLSAEALLRRVLKDKDLYRINNVVDITNLLSLKHYFSIGTYDASKIEGTATFSIGKANEPYEGLGRGVLNIENLPVFRDNQGSFGSPTSDSPRTSVKPETTEMLMNIISFGHNSNALETAVDDAVRLLKRYANASNFELQYIK